MIDFQGIHARHLQVFSQFASFRRRSSEPIVRVQRKIAGIKRLASTLAQMDKTRSTMLPRGFIGQKVNLLI